MFNIDQLFQSQKNPESPEERMLGELKRFVERKGLTDAQVQQAIDIYLDGKSDAGENASKEEVFALAAEFARLEKEGDMPVSLPAELLSFASERRPETDPSREMTDTLVRFAESNGMTTEEVDDAVSVYLSGEQDRTVSLDDSDDQVSLLLERFHKLEKESDMPANIPGAVLIELEKRDLEIRHFSEFVLELGFDEKTQKTLFDIILNGRLGTVLFILSHGSFMPAPLPRRFGYLSIRRRVEYVQRLIQVAQNYFGKGNFDIGFDPK